MARIYQIAGNGLLPPFAFVRSAYSPQTNTASSDDLWRQAFAYRRSAVWYPDQAVIFPLRQRGRVTDAIETSKELPLEGMAGAGRAGVEEP